jgi:hypothetical protein
MKKFDSYAVRSSTLALDPSQLAHVAGGNGVGAGVVILGALAGAGAGASTCAPLAATGPAGYAACVGGFAVAGGVASYMTLPFHAR